MKAHKPKSPILMVKHNPSGVLIVLDVGPHLFREEGGHREVVHGGQNCMCSRLSGLHVSEKLNFAQN